MPDIAGNSLATATTLNLTTSVQSFPDLVTSTTSDYYRFSLLTRSSVDLSLTNLDANADVALLDSEGNLLTVNSVPQRSANSGNLAESINTILDPGTYFIRVTAAPSVAIANYTLNVTKGTNAINSAILWRNPFSDETGIWQVTGASLTSTQLLTSNPGAGWVADATGDFNKDGQSDIFWRNFNTGATQIWLMNGVSVASIVPTPAAALGWYVGGTGDFTGDGQTDLLWRNDAAGIVGIWAMNGTQFVAPSIISEGVPAVWRVAGVGDFNKDGKPDIVWQNSQDQLAGVWLMDGISLSSSVFLPSNIPSDWFIAGTDDFNNDGSVDLLWRNYSTTANGVWLLNGVSFVSAYFLPPALSDWISTAPYKALGEPNPIDIAGDTLATAFDLGTNVTGTGSYQNTISSVSTDFYKFTLGSSSQVNLSLTGFTANLDLQLLDENGGILQTVAAPDLTPEFIARTLTVGTYYIQVIPNNAGDRSPYSLQISVNNLPVLTTNTPLPVNEQGTANLTSSQLRVTDNDNTAAQITYTLGSLPTNGTLSVNGAIATPGITFTQADLDSGNRIQYIHNGSETTSDSFIFTVADGAGGSIGTTTFNISVTPVNDSPVLTVPSSLTLDQNTNVLISGIQVADPDSGAGALTVTLSVQNGTLTLGLTNNLTGLQGNGTSTLSFSGQLDLINFVLQSLVYRSNATFQGTDVLTIGVNDNGNTGLGGPLGDSKSTTLTVSAVNQPPLISLPVSVSVSEDVPSPIAGITIADPNTNSGLVTASVLAVNGVVSLNSTAGLNVSGNNAIKQKNLVFTGTLSAVNNALNNLIYQSDPNFNGPDSLIINVNDNGNTGNGIPLSDTKTLGITVTPVNDAPVLTVPPAQTANENIDLRITGITVQDVDAGAGNLNVAISAANGKLTLGSINGLTFQTGTGTQDNTLIFSGSLSAINAALNTLIYRGNLNFRGSDSISINISDNGNTGFGVALGDSKTIAVNVLGINQPPTITLPTSPTVNSNTDLSIAGVSIADPDAAGGNMAVTITAANGLVSLKTINGLTFTQGNGNPSNRLTFSGSLFAINDALATLTYRSYPGFTNAFDRVTISVNDNGNTGTGLPLSDTKTLFVNVGGAVNVAPVATNDTYGISQNNTLNGNSVLGNDTDPDFTLPLTAQLAAGPTRAATFTLNPNGTFTYTPTTNFNGTDSFTYRVTDALGASSNIATVTITVTPVNQPPVAVNDSYTTGSSGSLSITSPGILANDTDIDSSNLSAVLVSSPANGTLNFNSNGSFTYVPRAGFTGTDSFTYRANDGSLNSLNTATVNISVTLTPNQLPVANGDTFTTSANSTLTVGNVLTNDTDPDNNIPLTASLLVGPANAATFTLNPNGTFTYIPRADFTGNDTFTYVARDSLGGTSTPATVTFSVTSVTPSNQPPVANGDTFTTPANSTLTVGNVLTNDTDPDNNIPLTASLLVGPANAATFTLNPNGTFTYIPRADFTGNDTFTYVARDSLGGTSTPATVTFSVTSVTPSNQPPVANGDTFTTPANSTLTVGNVLTNDTDPDNNIPLTASLLVGPANAATFTLNPNGTFTYIPRANFTGNDTFTYVARDSLGGTSSPATVTFSVTPGPAPTANNDTLSVNAGSSLNIAAPGILSNDTDPLGRPLFATVVSTVTNGTLSLAPTGALVYTPNAGYSGNDRFTYVATDGTGTSNTATVSIRVNAIPVARNDSGYTAIVGTPLTVSGGVLGVLGNDTDADNPTLTANLVSQPANGSLSLSPNGSFVYIPNANFQGTDTFTYTASDGQATSNTATVSISVRSVSTPVAVSDTYRAATNGTLTVSQINGVLNNDTDPNVSGNARTATIVTGPVSGLATLNPDGSFIYRPNPNFQGVDTFVYRFSDGLTVSNAATVTISVAPNTPPVANPDRYTIATGSTLTVIPTQGILLNDTDADPGTVLTATLNTTTQNGTLSFNSNGTFRYTPNAGFSGLDSFTYQASDGIALSNPTTATITVAAAPTAVADIYSVTAGQTLTINAPGLLANDIDPAGLSLSLIPAVPPTPRNGQLISYPNNGSFIYVPNPGFVGTDSFAYRATNGVLPSAPVTVTINVTNP
jgi:VCBS repeat-containing protein